MSDAVRVKNIGLRGVTVADTRISFIDGEQGILIYRGYRVEELAEKSSFVETAYLLLNNALPDKGQLETFTRRIMEARFRAGTGKSRTAIFFSERTRRTSVMTQLLAALAFSDRRLASVPRAASVASK